MANNLQSLLSQFDKRWLGAGLAAAGAVAGADQANAAVVHSSSIPAGNINVPSSFAGIYINVENGVTGASSGTTAGWDINPYGATYLRMFTPTGGGMKGAAAGQYSNLAPGTQICAADADWRTGVLATNSPGFPNVLNSSNNIYGMRFVDGGAVTRVGWFRMSLAATAGGQPRTVVEWAYQNTPGACLGAGEIPEPSSLALLAAGAVGLIARRRRTA